jgi:hypothetical protein
VSYSSATFVEFFDLGSLPVLHTGWTTKVSEGVPSRTFCSGNNTSPFYNVSLDFTVIPNLKKYSNTCHLIYTHQAICHGKPSLTLDCRGEKAIEKA